MREKTSITAIGSCRVSTPFKAAPQLYPVYNNTDRVYGYTHSSAEALQQIKFLQGDFAPLPDTLPVLMPNTDIEGLEATIHTPSDIYFIEFSSAKQLRIGDVQVQLNYVTQHFDDFFGDRTRAADFWRLADGSKDAEKQVFLDACAEYHALNDTDKLLLSELTRQLSTVDSIAKDIAEIQARLPRVVFITHCNANAINGQPIPSRAKYIAMVEEAAASQNAAIFNPTASMQAFGQADAMSDAETSLSHYSEEFGQFLFDGLFQRHITDLHNTGGRLRPTEALAKAITQFQSRSQIQSISPHIGGVTMITGSLGAGGAERQLTRLAVEMKKRQDITESDQIGITGNVEVVVSNLSPELGRDFFLPKLQDANVPVSVIKNLPATLEQGALSPDLHQLVRYLPPQTQDAIQRLTPHLLRERPEVAYIWQDGAVLATALAALAANIPRIVISLRGMPPNMRPEMMKDEYFEMYCALAKVPGVTFSANTYASADAYAEWLSLPQGSVETVHNAAEAQPTEGSEDDQQVWADFVGKTADADFTYGGIFRFDQNKRPIMWLEFAAAALAAYPRSRFVLVGDGVEFQVAQTFARDMGIADRCLFTGKSRHVGFWLNRMDALGLTSRLEGLPNVLIEAQFAGVPVISTPAGGAGEAFIPGQTGYLLDSTEAPRLPQFLTHYLDLATDKEHRRQMGIDARRFARKSFAIERIVPQTLDLLCDRPAKSQPFRKAIRA